MSKIGNEPIKYDKSKVTVTVEDGGAYNYKLVKVSGPQGELEEALRAGVDVKVGDEEIEVTRKSEAKAHRSFHGLYRSIISNMIQGVSEGFEKKLEIHGVGYRGSLQGNKLVLNLGFSHQVEYVGREGVTLEMPDENTIVVKGIDKQLVGQVAAEIRALRKPEPYKGKGIRYEGEQIRRKAGKSNITA